MASEELVRIVEQFAESGWDLIVAPSKKWLAASGSAETVDGLLNAVEQADKECGSCGFGSDPLYKRALRLLRTA
ncbi:MAG: hypothetical protein RDU89_03820 [bacterium]|nr:hypothetical protein [bacterium]